MKLFKQLALSTPVLSNVLSSFASANDMEIILSNAVAKADRVTFIPSQQGIVAKMDRVTFTYK